MRREGNRRTAGFTLLELIVVIAVIGILAAIAMPALKNVPRKANESVLKNNLRAMRDVIDQYMGDKGFYPPTLEALVEEGYLRAIPTDPVTKSRDTWVLVYDEAGADAGAAETDVPEGGEPGIIDIHSGSDQLSLDGTPYSEW